MADQDQQGILYTDHSGDERRRNQRPDRQQEYMDFNARATDGTGIGNGNVDSGVSKTDGLNLIRSFPAAEGFRAQSIGSNRAEPATIQNNADPITETLRRDWLN
ncbi:hypothetical protein PIB30_061531 [Stylosanthes scabra]|uniref:Uncharacterized protein n=1 Tax=Stylosanthes scabra TaxID=79078 RepID=A0ABU6ZJM4_9FABA|nr:hypothetical protein [Stylosanthes scabra]